jgi:hypothetical protein
MVTLTLAGPNDGPVCGDECAVIGAADGLSILSTLHRSAPVSGPTVPVAAIMTAPNGTTYLNVVDKNGSTEKRDVSIVVAVDGLAVVGGVSPGEQIVLGAEPENTRETPA